MPYKTPCYFRTHLNVCTFKEEDCCPEKCDMYNVEFTVKGVNAEIKKIDEIINEKNKEVQEWQKEIKANYDNYSEEAKEEKKQYLKDLLKEAKDLYTGKEYMKKAKKYCKRVGWK